MKNKKEYLRLVKKLTPKPNKKVDYTRAFLMGGTIGFLGEGIKIILMTYCDLSKDMATNYVLLITIFIACLLTGLGFFDNLVSKYKSLILFLFPLCITIAFFSAFLILVLKFFFILSNLLMIIG